MKIQTKFDFGDIVYIKSDLDQYPRQITEMNINPGSFVMYKLMLGDVYSWHHEIEIEIERDELLAIKNN